MNEPNPAITGQAAKLTTTRVNDAEQTTLVCVVHLNAKPVFAECNAVTRAGASRRIGKSPEGWKVDSASAVAFDDGTVRFFLSSYPDGSSGTEAAVRWVDFPSAVHPLPPANVGDGSGQTFIPAPGGYIRLYAGSFDGQTTLDLASFGIPAGIALLNLKVTVNAATVGARGRVGPHTGSSGAAMLATVVQAAGVRNYSFCQSAPGANNTLVLWADAGALSEFYVDCLGWWY